jgi:hypothetical protein
MALLSAGHAAPARAQGGESDSGASPSGGQDANRAAARELGKEALAAYKAADYRTAHDKFRRAHQLVRLTTTGLFTARSLEKLGRLVEASELYLEVTRMTVADDAPAQHRSAIDEARTGRDALLPRIPKLTISVERSADGTFAAEEVSVTLDGEPLPAALLGVKRPTDPGKHTVVATISDTEKHAAVTLAEGQDERVVLKLDSGQKSDARTQQSQSQPPTPEPGADSGTHAMTILGWVAVGVGGAGLIVGAVGTGLAASKKGELDDGCVDNKCLPPLHDDVDSYQTLRIMSSVGFIAGGVLAVTGIVLIIAAPDGSDQAALNRPSWGLAPYATPLGGGMVGWF